MNIYLAKRGLEMKVGGIPIRLKGDIIFETGTDLLTDGILLSDKQLEKIMTYNLEGIYEGSWLTLKELKHNKESDMKEHYNV